MQPKPPKKRRVLEREPQHCASIPPSTVHVESTTASTSQNVPLIAGNSANVPQETGSCSVNILEVAEEAADVEVPAEILEIKRLKMAIRNLQSRIWRQNQKLAKQQEQVDSLKESVLDFQQKPYQKLGQII